MNLILTTSTMMGILYLMKLLKRKTYSLNLQLDKEVLCYTNPSNKRARLLAMPYPPLQSAN